LCGCYAFARCGGHSTTLWGAIERAERAQNRINALELFLEDATFGGKCLDNRL